MNIAVKEGLSLENRPTSESYKKFLRRVSQIAGKENLEEAARRVASSSRPTSIKKELFKMGRSEAHFSSIFFDRMSTLCHRVKVGAAGFRALDIFYNWEDKYFPNCRYFTPEGMAAIFWIGGMENRQAVTNRKKIVVDLLAKRILSTGEEVVRIFSLAGGDGQTIIEAIKKAGKPVEVVLIDPDRDALASAQERAQKAGLHRSFKICRGIVSTANKMAKEFQPHIFDVVGLLDYLDDEKVVEVVNIAYKSLRMGGMLVTCNIVDNPERVFLENVLLWEMIYREPEALGCLIKRGGFQNNKIEIILEPLKIHAIAVCVK